MGSGIGQEAESSQRSKCQECGKSFASANAYTSHLNSRRHKEAVAKSQAGPTTASTKASVNPPPTNESGDDPLVFRIPASAASALSSDAGPREAVEEVQKALPNTAASAPEATPLANAAPTTTDADEAMPEAQSAMAKATALPAQTSLTLAADATDAEVEQAIAARLAASTRIDPSKQCIFCPSHGFADLDACLVHMQRSHGFFLPERPYITDLPGLTQYLADKVCVGHLCLYCNGRGRGFHSAEAARRHMISKSHCKVAYDREDDRLELGDFYDFSSSYPDYKAPSSAAEGSEAGDGWEDMDEDAGEVGSNDEEMEGEEDELSPADGVRYGDNELELVLPSGARLGHRTLARYYRQTLFSTPASVADSSGGAVARRLIQQGRAAGRNQELVIRDRHGGEVRARNRGEAKEAKRHVREFRDQARKEQFKTRVGFRHNNQKHFRDPLLQ